MNFKIIGDRSELRKEKSEKHMCVLGRSKRCAFCELDSKDNENSDLQFKFVNSIELAQGLIS
jgi:hypothetical protein